MIKGRDEMDSELPIRLGYSSHWCTGYSFGRIWKMVETAGDALQHGALTSLRTKVADHIPRLQDPTGGALMFCN